MRYVICVGASEGPVELAAPWERSGGRGRKLQALDGRCETRWYICAISDCWVWVSWKEELAGWCECMRGEM